MPMSEISLDISFERLEAELEEKKQADNKRKAEDSLSEYIRQAWHVVEPATPYLHNWHIDLICEYLESVTDSVIGNKPIDQDSLLRLIINIPPRYMKSLIVSVFWPTWVWIKYPWTRWVFASYSSGLSKKHSGDRRTTIQSPWYQERWGKVYQLSEDQNEKMFYENTSRGHMSATSIGGTATGKGGNFIVVDDPHNPQEAISDAQRQSGVDFFDQTLSTRLDNKKTGAIVIVMQRLHEEDLSGHLISNGGWKHLKLEAVAEGSRDISFPGSGKRLIMEDGSLLWPEREGIAEIESARRNLGEYGFAGQYQQRPSPAGGGILKRHWWRYWQYPGMNLPPVQERLEDGSLFECPVVDLPPVWEQQLQSWDMAFKDTKSSDYVVGQLWARVRANKYLLDQVRDKLSFVKSVEAVKNFTRKWPEAGAKLVEDKANGPAVIDTLRMEISGLIPIEPSGSKEARVHAVSPQIQSGNVILPHPMMPGYDWVRGYVERSAQFPFGAHDDEQDATSQALNHMPKVGFAVDADDLVGQQRATAEYLN